MTEAIIGGLLAMAALSGYLGWRVGRREQTDRVAELEAELVAQQLRVKAAQQQYEAMLGNVTQTALDVLRRAREEGR